MLKYRIEDETMTTRGNNLIESLIALANDGDKSATSSAATATFTPSELKDFLDAIPGAFFLYRATGDEEILYANRALYRLFHCANPEEFRALTGNTFRGLVHPDDLEAVEESIHEQILSNQDELDYAEYRILTREGELRWVEDYGHFVHTDSGGIFYVFVSDATEKITRRILERETLITEGEAREAHLKGLIEAYDEERKLIRQEHLQRLEVIEGLSINYESILYADLLAGIVLPYRMSSRIEPQFKKKYGVIDFDRFIEHYVETVVYPDDRAFVKEHTSREYIQSHLSNERTYYFNYRSLENGTVKYLQVRIVNVGDKGGKFVFGCRSVDDEILQEIKSKQILEEALRAAKAADVAKNAFLSNMSHDMRTPLNAIFGFTELLRKQAGNASVTKEYLDKIELASEHMLHLIEKVLDFSYLESGEATVACERCDMDELLTEIHASVLPLAKRKGIDLIFEKDSLRFAYGDREKIKQVLLSLLDNAVTYTNAGGTVWFTAKAEGSGEFVTYRILVKDTGIGISKAQAESIFMPFERVNNTTHSGEYGTGLGLTIAKRLAEMMGGSLTLESEEGKGSSFFVTLCLRRCEEKGREQNTVDLTGKKILLAEDNEINRELQTALLEDAGFTVDTAENGQIALDLIERAAPNEYALILMDIQMPVMDGQTAARNIRRSKNPAVASIPIIALSANAFESDVRASIESGMDAHLSKPMDIALLLRTVREVLERKNS